MELLLLAVLIVLGVIVFKHAGEIKRLTKELDTLKSLLNPQNQQSAKIKREHTPVSPEQSSIVPFKTSDDSSQAAPAISAQSEPSAQPDATEVASIFPTDITDKPRFSGLVSHLQQHGLLWFGALVLAMGGIFLAKYSIEAGLFPPQLRILLGSMFGVALVAGAEYLARHRQRFNIQSPYVNAALASGGVITCFAMAYVSFDIYSYLSPQWAFALLGLIALASTYLALRFGPVLAYIGLIGAYAVPALIESPEPNIMALLLYTGFVSASAIWVSETVSQRLLWWMALLGHMLWFGVALLVADTHDFISISLFTLASVYIFVLVNVLGWHCQHQVSSPFSAKTLLMPRKEQLGVLLPLIMFAIHLAADGSDAQVWISAIMVAVVLCALPLRHSALDSWPFLALLFFLLCFGLLSAPKDFVDNLFPYSGQYLLIQIAAGALLMYSAMMIRHDIQRRSYLLLLVLAPLLLYGVSYAVSPDQAGQYLYPLWAIQLAVIAVAAAITLQRSRHAELQVTCAILFNACLSLVMTMLLEASTLTFAIALQIAGMSFLARKYAVALPDWLFKAALAVVLIRLTMAPWLSDYADETILGLRWTIIIYPVVLAVIVFAKRYCTSVNLGNWYGGALLHVIALLVTTESSYLLTGDYPDLFNAGYQENVLLAMNWLILSGAYLWRAQFSGLSQKVCVFWSGLLALGAIMIHMNVSLAASPFMQVQPIGEHMLVNWLVAQWLVPGLVLIAMLRLKLVHNKMERPLWLVSAALLFLYINGVIRNAFQQGNVQLSLPTTDAELYTYSVVWLVIATLMVFGGYFKQSNDVTRVGFIMLFVVVLKAFIVDMNNLEGLYRALSFIGLGLCLVGIGWLFQRIRRASDAGSGRAESATGH